MNVEQTVTASGDRNIIRVGAIYYGVSLTNYKDEPVWFNIKVVNKILGIPVDAIYSISFILLVCILFYKFIVPFVLRIIEE